MLSVPAKTGSLTIEDLKTLKPGDRVVVRKPNKLPEHGLAWPWAMDAYNGLCIETTEVLSGQVRLTNGHGWYYFLPEWLEWPPAGKEVTVKNDDELAELRKEYDELKQKYEAQIENNTNINSLLVDAYRQRDNATISLATVNAKLREALDRWALAERERDQYKDKADENDRIFGIFSAFKTVSGSLHCMLPGQGLCIEGHDVNVRNNSKRNVTVRVSSGWVEPKGPGLLSRLWAWQKVSIGRLWTWSKTDIATPMPDGLASFLAIGFMLAFLAMTHDLVVQERESLRLVEKNAKWF